MKENYRNKLFNNYILKILCITIFLLIFITCSYKISPFKGVTSYGDSSYYYGFNQFSMWQQNIKNGVNVGMISFLYNPIIFCNAILLKLGLNWNFASYILWLSPIIFCFYVYFSIGYKLTKNYLLSLIAGLLIVFSNESLEYLFFFPKEYFLFMGLIGIYIYYSMKIIENNKIETKDSILIILSSILILHPFFMVIFLIYWFILIATLLINNKLKIIGYKKMIVIPLMVLMINSYWIIPMISSLVLPNHLPASEYGQNNFLGVYQGFLERGEITKIIHGWTYPKPSINDLLPIVSTPLNILISFSLWLILLLLLLKGKISKELKLLLFISVVIFLSISFSPNNPLIKYLWDFLFNNYGFMGFFRSFTRFAIFLLPILIISGILFYKNIKIKYKNYLLLVFIVVFFLSRIFLFTGNFGGALPNTYIIPEEYNQLNEKLNNESNIFSLAKYPFINYEGYDWNINEGVNKFPQVFYFLEYYLSKNVIYDKAAFDLQSLNEYYKKLFPKGDQSKEEIIASLKKTNIKYIILNKDAVDISNENKTKTKDITEYKDFFKKENLQLIDENDKFLIYENSGYLPILNSENSKIIFKKYYDTKFSVYISNIHDKKIIRFLINFDRDWKLYLKKNPSSSWCNPIKFYNNTNTTECEHTQKFFEGEELKYLYEKPIFDNTHELVYEYANGWTIDPQYIKDNYSKEYYTENPDGSINIELVLYFKPQSYFYLGIIISGITITICIIYLIISGIRQRKNKNIEVY